MAPSQLQTSDAGMHLAILSLASLQPHPRNYQHHTEAELLHLAQSLTDHGQYKLVIVAQDQTILAGHGLVQAMRRLGWEHAACHIKPYAADSPEALALLAGDNELARLAYRDDRQLADLVQGFGSPDIAALLGTGFDGHSLAALVYTTRPSSEIGDHAAAATYAGLPAAAMPQLHQRYKITISFRSGEERAQFIHEHALPIAPGSSPMLRWVQPVA